MVEDLFPLATGVRKMITLNNSDKSDNSGKLINTSN